MSSLISFYLLIYLPLAIVALVLSIRSYRRKQKTQAFIFALALAFCIFQVLNSIISLSRFDKKDYWYRSFVHEDVDEGDTSTFSAWVLFRKYENESLRDTMEKIERELQLTTGQIYFKVELPDPDMQWHIKTIFTDSIARDSLSKYMDFRKQQQDTNTYRFTMRVLKKSKLYEEWKLLQLIEVDTLRELPHYWF